MTPFDAFLVKLSVQIINPLIKLLFAGAIGYFLWGCAEFFLNSDSEEARTKFKTHAIVGTLAITGMLGVWVIVSMIIHTFGIQGIEVDNGNINVHLVP